MKIIKIILITLMVLNLSSCNKNENIDNDKFEDSSFTHSLEVKFVKPNVWTKVIDARNGVQIIDSQLILGDTKSCMYKVENKSINVHVDNSSFCVFNYVSQNENFENSYGSISVSSVSQPSGSGLIGYKSTNVLDGENNDINLKRLATPLSLLDHDATLLDEAFVIADDGSSYTVATSSTTDSIALSTPESGVEQLVYAYKQNNGDILQGVVFVARNNESNTSPVANPLIKNIDVDTTAIIDVSDIISDSDGDMMQLISVKDYEHLAKIEDVSNVSNTKFVFSSNKPGVYDVYYSISDHHGGIATNFVRFNVSEPDGLLSNIFVTPIEGGSEFIYSFPENAEQANSSQHGGYNGLYTEDGTLGLSGETYPFYNYSHASAVCLLKGLKLPSVEEMSVLWTEKGDLFRSDSWPTTLPYIVFDSSTNKPNTYNMHDGSLGTPSNNAHGYVTCVGYSYDRFDIQEKFAAKNSQRKLHTLAYSNDVIVPVEPNIVEWSVDDPSIATISPAGVLSTYDVDGVVTVTAVSDAGSIATQEITITDNLFTLWEDSEQDPTFDKGVISAGINYSTPCTEEDHDLFFDLTGFDNEGMGSIGSGHTAPILCTNNAEHIPYSGRGYIRTDGWAQGSGEGAIGVNSASNVIARTKVYPKKEYYILSAAMNLKDLLSNPETEDITSFALIISANLTDTYVWEYGSIRIIAVRDPDNPNAFSEFYLKQNAFFESLDDMTLEFNPSTFWVNINLAGKIDPRFLREYDSIKMEYKYSMTPYEGTLGYYGADYHTILDEIGVFIY